MGYVLLPNEARNFTQLKTRGSSTARFGKARGSSTARVLAAQERAARGCHVGPARYELSVVAHSPSPQHFVPMWTIPVDKSTTETQITDLLKKMGVRGSWIEPVAER